MEKYEIRSIENGFIYLYDKKKNTYCKIDYIWCLQHPDPPDFR